MKKQFETESRKVLDLMIHSIYTNKEIFLRELISNASDAIDKRVFSMLQEKDESFNRDDLFIEIKLNPDQRYIEIEDFGIGMSKEDLEENLGVIAKSGSLDFKEKNKNDEISIIGQFGVGFYSAFMVASKLEVRTKKLNEKAYSWISQGTDGYEIEEIQKDQVGTSVRIYLKEDSEDENYSLYTDQYYIQELVEKYSNYIKYPIKLNMKKTRAKSDDPEDHEVEEYYEMTTLNSMVPIWKKDKASLKDEDYINFYKEQRYGFDEPLAWIHLNAEGLINYRAILFIPSKPSFNYYTKDFKKGLQLYSNGVMIMESNEDLLPDYLAFVKGVVDSEDLSLNISREILQQDRRLMSIAKNIERKILAELRTMLKDDRKKYEEFFESFGLSLKAGIYTSYGQKRDLTDLLLFSSSKSDEKTSLKEYVERKLEGQDKIFYASGKDYKSLDKNPALDKLKKEGFEILYLTDEIDEFVIKMLLDFEEMTFVSAIDYESEVEDQELDEAEKTNRKSLFDKMKDFLPEDVVEVKESNRLETDASILSSKGELSIEMERTLSLQPDAPDVKADKVLEINPKHKIFDKLMKALSTNDQEKLELITKVLYDQSRLIAGLQIEDVVEYTKRVNELIQ
ncbi:MAG: molecular chaperone HtpG [Tissierellia bacterium]|nr:molecular chaperone HtpG [Tissierellia bacterium]